MTAFRGRDGGITFNTYASATGIPMQLPCGKCQGCRLEHSRIWAVRCVHESKMHAENSFLTLTYSPDKLPENGTLIKRDLQLFFKRLRKSLHKVARRKVRYYACGEYGDENQRPHYHVILFGLMFGDKRPYSYDPEGNPVLWTSHVLNSIWGHGSCMIGAVNFKTCSYVARYCMKKVDGAKREAGHYLVYTSDGVVSERLPEFALMSRRPGIGTPWYDKYGNEVRNHDSIVIDGKEVPSIRYYDLKFEALDPEGYERVKRKRSRATSIVEHRRRLAERKPERMRVREVLLMKRMKEKARKL
ncbi:replication initiator protein [Blackfly microvirus SF02]|uniref:Replication initiator protein n=1 Tax=Blackfly microvirus SF02 TaxID=2576452 RepID=A0A4P8PRQ5_9VIRU|nr:replication initiator protein [Blackfly microvirus SF02]